MEREGHCLLPRDRRPAGGRQGGGLDGACHQEHVATVAAGSRRYGRISEIAAAGRGPAAAEEDYEVAQPRGALTAAINISAPASARSFRNSVRSILSARSR